MIAGLVPIAMPGLPVPVRLGLAGGPLVAAIVLSWLGRIGKVVWSMPVRRQSCPEGTWHRAFSRLRWAQSGVTIHGYPAEPGRSGSASGRAVHHRHSVARRGNRRSGPAEDELSLFSAG